MATQKFDESQLSPQERREFQRLYFDFQQGQLRQILGAQVSWPDQSQGEIYDMSYTGAAVRRPKKLEVKRGEFYRLQVQLGDQEPVEAEAEIIWTREKIAGIRWAQLPAQVHRAFSQFMGDKLIGANLVSVHSQFFSKNMTFDHWLHGPKDTNLYLWLQRDELGKPTSRVEKAIIDLDEHTLVFEYGTLSCGKRSPDWDIQRDYGEIDDWLENWQPVESGAPLVKRAISIISQVPELKAPLRSLIETLHLRSGEEQS